MELGITPIISSGMVFQVQAMSLQSMKLLTKNTALGRHSND
jgi:preprotein translocase subunit SecY